MHRSPWISRLAGMVLALASPLLTAAEAPVLARLEYSKALLAPTAKIRLANGAVASPFANRPHRVWTLREGEALKQANRPAERLIQFYQVRQQEIQVVASLFVKYVAGRKGWRPAFALHVSPPAYWDGQRIALAGRHRRRAAADPDRRHRRGCRRRFRPCTELQFPGRSGIDRRLGSAVIAGSFTGRRHDPRTGASGRRSPWSKSSAIARVTMNPK
ncbi:MAG: hypothetical protein MZV65_37695 [Chromatiales bacterium]|nr:hypothetical protein [Chromatiales bacterium]